MPEVKLSPNSKHEPVDTFYSKVGNFIIIQREINVSKPNEQGYLANYRFTTYQKALEWVTNEGSCGNYYQVSYILNTNCLNVPTSRYDYRNVNISDAEKSNS